MPPARFPDDVPVLTDGTVTLRAHRRADLPRILEMGTDPQMQRWTTVPRDYGPDDARGLLEHVRTQWEDPAGERVWAVEVLGADGRGRFAGNVDLRPRGDGRAGLGYGLHPGERGRGVMSSAVRLACRHAFDVGFEGTRVQRVHWDAIVGNFASRRVAWSTGFTHHGTLPDGVDHPDRGLLPVWLASLGPEDPMEPRTTWYEPEVVEDELVRLRPWRDSDGDRLPGGGPGPSRHVPAGAMGTSTGTQQTFAGWLLERRERMAEGQGVYWCAADPGTDDPLGAVMLFEHGQPMVPPSAEIGYWLYPSGRGRGVATAAVRAATALAFAPTSRGGLGLHAVRACTAADNLPSVAVLTRAGFTVFGTEHETDLLPDGSWADALHWELLSR